MWVPMAALSARLTLSAVTGAGALCILGPRVVRRKECSEALRRALSDSRPQPLPSPVESSPVHRCRLEHKRYITSRKLAGILALLLQEKQNTPQVVLECNPGPGILTQALLETGARVIALESERTFIPHLESLGKQHHGKLDVVHCDFFKMDPQNSGLVKPPVVLSQTLFHDLEIEGFPWSAGIPLKVFGIFPMKNEKKALWKLIYSLYSCTSIYRYGRVELNMFISEKEYQKLMAKPTDGNLYQVLSVLWQVACNIRLLHMEPWSSFDLYTQNGQLHKIKSKELAELIQQNLYFVQMTPRKALFTENLTPVNYEVFFHMLKQCFVKRNANLVDHLHSLSPVDAMDLLSKIRKHKNMKITNMYPLDFKRLFEAVECSRGYTYKWLCNDIIEDKIM
ncbi:PREDICTED: dimethyladenosine transferase 2, mitochondrial [Elephantulus edwardii]|uniref:dimethyladenosine transferase 2, mitochondrial n=1 Tax=Elephantulus edwardii TaxID=28737 RepID=UPI0003F0ACF6|nr:PREDICTED: dimethyladenosine transferase 2, mitochondrial [Elephantulus edwardii]